MLDFSVLVVCSCHQLFQPSWHKSHQHLLNQAAVKGRLLCQGWSLYSVLRVRQGQGLDGGGFGWVLQVCR